MTHHPTTHQELFLMAIRARKSVIHEFEGDIRRKCFELRAWARRYALDHGLEAPTDPEDYGIYYELDADELKEWGTYL